MAKCSGGHEPGKCAECDAPQLARNHFFTGKLLVVRDFNDEQHYFMGKDRRHNRALHGWGVVCGLKVKQHPNSACRAQYVVIEQGTAVDCCGREVLLQQEELFDFRARVLESWQRAHGKGTQPGGGPQRLQICLRYVECGSEDIPALFSECGCDDTACQPNRVVEGYEFDVILDAPRVSKEPIGVRLDYHSALNLADAHPIAVAQAGNKIYVLTDAVAALSVFSADKLWPLPPSQALPGAALDLALSPDGSRAYVAVEGADPDPVIVQVLDTSKLGQNGAVIQSLTIADAKGAGVRLAVSPADGSLFVLNVKGAKVLGWDKDLNPLGEVAAGTGPWGMVVSPDGKWLYVANSGDANVAVFATSTLAAQGTIDITGAAPYALAVASTTAEPRLYVADRDNKSLRIFKIQPGATPAYPSLGAPQPLPEAPLALAVSGGGRWIYALVVDGAGKGKVQVIDAHRVETNAGDALGATLEVGGDPRDVLLAGQDRRLYAAFAGPVGPPTDGGVAIVDVVEEACGELFERTLNGCPDCDTDNCLVLATVEQYVFDQPVDDAGLDNLIDRKLLPSTDVLTDVVRCILEQGNGTVGEQGPPGPAGPTGPTGPAGPGVKSADAESGATAQASYDPNTGNIHFVIPRGDPGDPGVSVKTADAEAGTPVSATFNPTTGNIHFVIPPGPKGNKGDKGDAATPLDLPSIVAIGWPHNGVVNLKTAEGQKTLDLLNQFGLVVAFEKAHPVLAETLTPATFEVWLARPEQEAQHYQLTCYCKMRGLVTGIPDLQADCNGINQFSEKIATSGPVVGARFRPSVLHGNEVPVAWIPGDYLVVLKGDFILGANMIILPDGRKVFPALDANHLGPGLIGIPGLAPSMFPPGLSARCPTGNMTEGGTFESWFRIADE